MKISRKNGMVICAACMICGLGGCVGKSGDRLFQEGVEAYEKDNYNLAIKKFEKAKEMGLEKYSEATVYSYLGKIYWSADSYEEAIENYTMAQELEPEVVGHSVNLGVAYRQSGEMGKALEVYQQALEKNPEHAGLNTSLGVFYIMEEQPETAVYYFDKALEKNPRLEIAYGNGALAYAMIGEFEKSEEYLNKAIEYGYENVEAVKERIEAIH